MEIITEPYNDNEKLNEMESQINEYMRIIQKITFHYLYNSMPAGGHNINNPIKYLTTLLQELEKIYLKNNKDKIEKAEKHGGKVIAKMFKYFKSEDKKKKEREKTWLEMYEFETGLVPTFPVGNIKESTHIRLKETTGFFLEKNMIPTADYIRWVIEKYENEK